MDRRPTLRKARVLAVHPTAYATRTQAAGEFAILRKFAVGALPIGAAWRETAI